MAEQRVIDASRAIFNAIRTLEESSPTGTLVCSELVAALTLPLVRISRHSSRDDTIATLTAFRLALDAIEATQDAN